MRILVLTYMDPVRANSSASITLNRLLSEWHRQGHDITLFYSDGIGDYGKSDEIMTARLAQIRKFKIRSLENCYAFRILFRISTLTQLPDRSLPNHFRMTGTIIRHLRGDSSYDFILSWSFRHSIHLAALRIASLTRIPWFVYLSDPWADNGTGFGDFHSWELVVNRLMERRTIASATGVFFTSNAIRRMVMGKYPKSWLCKTDVNITGYDPALYPVRISQCSPKISICYVGAFYGSRSPEIVLRALRCLGDAADPVLDRIRFRFVGNSGTLVLELARRYRVRSDLIEVVPAVSYVESLQEMCAADVLLSIDADTATNIFLPSKLIDYAGAGKLIWAITPVGATAEFVKGMGGIVSDVHDPQGVAHEVVCIANRLRRAEGRSAGATPAPQLHVTRTSQALLHSIRRRMQIAYGPGCATP